MSNKKCSCYQEIPYQRYDFSSDMSIIDVVKVCFGTRERDECNCGGDPAKCDFYPEKREKYEGVSITMSEDIQSYIKHKIKLLRQLCVRLTNEQLEHLLSLKTEIAVDNYAHDLIVGKGDE